MLVMGAALIAMTWSAINGAGHLLVLGLFLVATGGGFNWSARKYSRWSGISGPASTTHLADGAASPAQGSLTRVLLYGIGVAFMFSPLRDYWASVMALVSGFIAGVLAAVAKFDSSRLG